MKLSSIRESIEDNLGAKLGGDLGVKYFARPRLNVPKHPSCPGNGAAQPGNGGASLLPSGTPRKKKYRRYMRTEVPLRGTDQDGVSGEPTQH